MNMKAELKVEYKCPWCGTVFQNGKDLDAHAREHYAECSLT
jgi:uncharacterized C2H2 Zn-finger protein